jgi:hypothetical protein
MQVSELARVFAGQVHDGEELPIAGFTCAIPYFFVWVSACCVERRDLGLVREFLLRAVQAGFCDENQLIGFLGMQVDEVRPEIAGLKDEVFLATNEQGRLVLTEKAVRAISEQRLTRTTVREIPCIVNGITRGVEVISRDLVPRKRLTSGVLVLPAVPARPPQSQDLNTDAVKRAAALSRTPLPRVLEIARLGNVLRSRTLFEQAHLLLWAGEHSVPLLSVNGVPANDMARLIGGHPALQLAKSVIGRHIRDVKRAVGIRNAALRTASACDAQVVRKSLVAFVAAEDADAASRQARVQQFVSTIGPLLVRSHWVDLITAQLLFAYAVAAAHSRLVLVAPSTSQAVFGRPALDALADCSKRGVQVTLHVPAGASTVFTSSGSVMAAFANIRVVRLAADGAWCGFAWDHSCAVVGMCRSTAVSMGSCDLFYGVLSLGRDSEVLLDAAAIQGGPPVVVKRRARAAALNPTARR